MESPAQGHQPTIHWFPAIFLSVSYALMCGLVVFALRLASGRSAASLPRTEALLPWQAFALILAGVLIGGLMIRKLKTRTAWELILGAGLFLGVWFYLWVAFSGEIGLLVASALTLIQAFVRRVWIHDVFILLGAAGVALNFGFLLPSHTILIVLVGLALYDTFAGRPDGVGAQFAASLVHRGVIPGIIVTGNLKDVGGDIATVIARPSSILLGAGDLILPIILLARTAALAPPLAVFILSLGILSAAAWIGARGPSRPAPSLLPFTIAVGIPYLSFMLLHLV
jgi:hypothetical protein